MKCYFVDRSIPIKKFEEISFLDNFEYGNEFKVNFSKYEIYCFQLAILSSENGEINYVKTSGNGKYTCINTEGINNCGCGYTIIPKIYKDEIKPLFIIFDYTESELKSDSVTIEICINNEIQKICVEIQLSDEIVENKGFNDLWRLSRLAWLNSDKAIDNIIPKPFIPIKNNGLVFEILGRRITFGENALPEKVESFFDEGINLCPEKQCDLLDEPVLFSVPDAVFKIKEIRNDKNTAEIISVGSSNDCELRVITILRYDGSMEFDIMIKSLGNVSFDNLSFSYGLTEYAARYMNGFSKTGGRYEDFCDGFAKGKQFDSLFCGNVNTGIRVKFKDENYIKPFCNIYYHNKELVIPEKTWNNNGIGKISTIGRRVSFDTGRYSMCENEVRCFKGEIHITPFKAIDYKKHYGVRYYHNEHLKNVYDDIDEAEKLGFNHIIYHHGTSVNPYINYPFVENNALKNAVDIAKGKGINTKIYYTIRECSNHMAEVFAYKALESEIIVQKKGDGASWQGGEMTPWIEEYFGENVIPAWKVKFDPDIYESDDDAAMIVSPGSRLENYYIEGLDWLVTNIGIKGIYIDDTALGRKALERARKVLERCDGLIDMHTWNHHNDWSGNVSSINLYTEILPYINSMWIGEDFDMYKSDADFIMIEMSAIPYGLTSQMLGGIRNFYAGLLYAMNFRYKWADYTDEMYKLWDDFGIEESEMLGYWHSKNPVYTDNENVVCTTYLKKDKAMICLYNFSYESEKFNIILNEKEIGFDASDVMHIPCISGYQEQGVLMLRDELRLEGRGGKVLYINIQDLI